MRRQLIALFFAWGCGTSEAEAWLEASKAPDWESAKRACGEIDGPRHGACLTTAAEELGRLDVTDCAAITDPRWLSECRFLTAERLAAAGRAEEAVAACIGSEFQRQCGYHLLRAAARPTVRQSPAEAAKALEPWKDMAAVPDAERLFWKAWFREKRPGGEPRRLAGCPNAECVQGARETLYQSLFALQRADAEALCSNPPTTVASWADEPEVRELIAVWLERECGRGAPTEIPPAR